MLKRNQSNSEMLKGTLDIMILRTLVGGDAYGYTIAKVIERTSENQAKREVRDEFLQVFSPQAL